MREINYYLLDYMIENRVSDSEIQKIQNETSVKVRGIREIVWSIFMDLSAYTARATLAQTHGVTVTPPIVCSFYFRRCGRVCVLWILCAVKRRKQLLTARFVGDKFYHSNNTKEKSSRLMLVLAFDY